MKDFRCGLDGPFHPDLYPYALRACLLVSPVSEDSVIGVRFLA